jgi:hypothetical protein
MKREESGILDLLFMIIFIIMMSLACAGHVILMVQDPEYSNIYFVW